MKWAEECNLLQTWYVDKYINRCWRRKDGLKFVAKLKPTRDQWQEFVRTEERNCVRTLVRGDNTKRRSLIIPELGRDRGNVVLFVLERTED